MTLSHDVDVVFEGVLIYEGAVLAQRRLLPRPLPLPTVTEIVGRVVRHPYGWVLPTFIVGWLSLHFWRTK